MLVAKDHGCAIIEDRCFENFSWQDKRNVKASHMRPMYGHHLIFGAETHHKEDLLVIFTDKSDCYVHCILRRSNHILFTWLQFLDFLLDSYHFIDFFDFFFFLFSSPFFVREPLNNSRKQGEGRLTKKRACQIGVGKAPTFRALPLEIERSPMT